MRVISTYDFPFVAFAQDTNVNGAIKWGQEFTKSVRLDNRLTLAHTDWEIDFHWIATLILKMERNWKLTLYNLSFWYQTSSSSSCVTYWWWCSKLRSSRERDNILRLETISRGSVSNGPRLRKSREKKKKQNNQIKIIVYLWIKQIWMQK